MRAATSALSLVPIGFTVVAVVACNAITGIGDLARGDSASDAGDDGAPCGGVDLTSDANNCGACGHACGQGNFCSSSSCVQGCTGGLLYVSPTGSDAATGCTTDAPLQTVAHAVALAKAQGSALVQEVHVCKGIYKEPQITLDFKASLRGGYDCTTWKRTPNFGYPLFDVTNATELDSSVTSVAGSITTLIVGGAPVDKSVVVDGWTIRGSSAATTTIALGLVAGGARIADDQILGGTPTEGAAPNASIGIQIGGAGSPEITSCKIDGGGGISTSTSNAAAGSVGILVASDSAFPNIHGNTISGGGGTAPSGAGSTGISIGGGTFSSAGATSNVITANTINGGTGKVTASGTASVGIASVAATSIEIDGNSVSGGSGSCASASGVCTNAGISAGIGVLTARGNRIYGGDATGAANGGSIGISVSGLTTFVAENNMIHGGNKSGDGKHGSAVGIEITQTAAPKIRNNTIYSGNAGGSVSATATDIVIAPEVTGIVAENDLLLTSGSRDASFIVSCSPNLFASFRNDVALAPTNVIVYGGGGTGTCGGTAASFPTMSAAETFVKTAAPSALVASNVSVGTCTAGGTCPTTYIANWNSTDNGLTTLLGDGWKLTPMCTTTQAGLDISATLKTDLYGTPRTVPLSVGAHENDATCTP